MFQLSNQYNELIDELNENKGSTNIKFRKKMSEIAFSETGYYDSLITNYYILFYYSIMYSYHLQNMI